MQHVEDVGAEGGVRGLMRRQRLEELARTGHRERQDQPVRLGQGQRPVGRLAGRALVAERTVGEPGQQARLHDGDVADNRGGAVEHRLHHPRFGSAFFSAFHILCSSAAEYHFRSDW